MNGKLWKSNDGYMIFLFKRKIKKYMSWYITNFKKLLEKQMTLYLG